MAVKQFYLLGDPVSSARNIELDQTLAIDGLKDLIASHFAIVSPNGWSQSISFQTILSPFMSASPCRTLLIAK
jgi:hypothetical protein